MKKLLKTFIFFLFLFTIQVAPIFAADKIDCTNENAALSSIWLITAYSTSGHNAKISGECNDELNSPMAVTISGDSYYTLAGGNSSIAPFKVKRTGLYTLSVTANANTSIRLGKLNGKACVLPEIGNNGGSMMLTAGDSYCIGISSTVNEAFSYTLNITYTAAEEPTACVDFAQDNFNSGQQDFIVRACTALNPTCFNSTYYAQLLECCGNNLDCATSGVLSNLLIPSYTYCKNDSSCNGTTYDSSSGYYYKTVGSVLYSCDPDVPWDDIKACSNVKFGGGGGGDPITVDPRIIDLNPDQLTNINPLNNSTVFGTDRSPANVINQALNRAIFPLAGSILFLLLVYGGFQIISASLSGKQNYIDIGKQRITAAIIGFILLFVSYWLWRLVMLVLGIGT